MTFNIIVHVTSYSIMEMTLKCHWRSSVMIWFNKSLPTSYHWFIITKWLCWI